MEHGIVQMSNPRYFGLFNPGPNFPAQCADRIAGSVQSAAGEFGFLSRARGDGKARDSRHRAARRRCGEDSDRAFRHRRLRVELHLADLRADRARIPSFAGDGVRAFAGPVKFYTSRDCHIAWLKIAHQAGVGRSALRLVDTDGRGRMDAECAASAPSPRIAPAARCR